MAKRKRVDSGEQEEPVSKPAASTDSETSDSDNEVWQFLKWINKFKKLSSTFCHLQLFDNQNPFFFTSFV